MNADQPDVPHYSLSSWTFWKACQIVLGFAVGLVLLVGAVFAVMALLDAKLPDRLLLGRDLVGVLVCGIVAYLLGKVVARARRNAFGLAIAYHASAVSPGLADSTALYNLAMACQQRRQLAQAIALYDVVIRHDPKHAYAYVGRVNAYGAAGQFDRAIADYTEVIRRDPGHALAYAARATAYNGVGRFDRSIPDATEAIRLAPEKFLGYDARGYGYVQRGNYRPGIKAVAILWMVVTFAFLKRDRFDLSTPTGTRADFEQAIADFTEAIRLNPDARDCYHGRAMAYRALGETAKALADQSAAFAPKATPPDRAAQGRMT